MDELKDFSKKNIRTYFLEKRQRLTSEELDAKSQQIAQNFFKYIDLSKIRTLHVFLPIQKKKEINTWYIIHEIQKKYPFITLLTSLIDFSTSEMTTCLLEENSIIQENKWGIPEVMNPMRYQGNIDLILIPLLAFDKEGNRIGYGKGYYDKFLQKNTNTYKIGLSLEEPITYIVSPSPLDIKIDSCITTAFFYQFK